MDKDRRKNPNEKIRVFLFLDYLTHSEKCDILEQAKPIPGMYKTEAWRYKNPLILLLYFTGKGGISMNITMAGIDFHRADIAVRERFSMTATTLRACLRSIRKQYPELECVLITTCNRTELWTSSLPGSPQADPVLLLCEACRQPVEEFSPYFSIRKGKEAVQYLCELSSGLHSQIFGDDQIISQVKSALKTAREEHAVGAVLEVLFRTAITGAKKVKSSILCSGIDRSVSSAMIRLLREKEIPIAGQSCLVIGNGEIGRLAAQELEKAGGKVTMTLRQYKHKEVVIPAGCSVVSYDKRYEQASGASIIVSATLSPHFTLQPELLSAKLSGPVTLIDLAIPRDIEPGCASLPDVTLFDMDCFSKYTGQAEAEQLRSVREILKEYETEFENWYFFREYIPTVKEIGHILGKEIAARLEKELNRSSLTREESDELRKKIRTASGKVVSNLLYGTRDVLDRESLKRIFPALEASAQRLKK